MLGLSPDLVNLSLFPLVHMLHRSNILHALMCDAIRHGCSAVSLYFLLKLLLSLLLFLLLVDPIDMGRPFQFRHMLAVGVDFLYLLLHFLLQLRVGELSLLPFCRFVVSFSPLFYHAAN